MRQFNTRELLKGPLLAWKYRFFKKAPYWSKKRRERYQLEQIKDLVTFAYNNVPFYHKKYSKAAIRPRDIQSLDDFRKLPTVTKQEILSAPPDQVIAHNTKLKNCIISTSSGSTGEVMRIAHSVDAIWAYAFARQRLIQMIMHYTPFTRQAYVYTSPYPANSFFGFYPSYFIPTISDCDEIVQKLKKIKPHLLVCYPSTLREIARYLSPKGAKQLMLKAISLNSELSTQKERDAFSQFFQCGVYDEYSSEELVWIAAQCKQKQYHIFEDVNYVEILDEQTDKVLPEGERGEIVGTNLHNLTMPFIRYRQGDYGAVHTRSCKCGWNFRLLTHLEGRKNDDFILPSGKILSAGCLLDMTYNLVLNLRIDIKDVQVIQESKGEIRIDVVPGTTFTQNDVARIRHFFAQVIKEPMEIKILLKRSIGVLGRKKRPITSLLTQR